MFGQTFSTEDLATIGMLVVLEGLLSLDNALVLGLLASRLNPRQRMRALSYGLIGAFVFRLVAIGATAYLLRFPIIKLLGGLYLVWVFLKFLWEQIAHCAAPKVHRSHDSAHAAGFWQTVAAIELTDIAFAVDSILATVALVGGPPPGTADGAIHPKLWVIVIGGMLGVILMRFAAALFAKLLGKFPRLNFSAYALVALIGLKLILDWAVNTQERPNRIDFQNASRLPFWIFWGAMLICLAGGFLVRRDTSAKHPD
jgi:YkoY family integral membrane protein